MGALWARPAAAQTDEQRITQVVQRFFDALGNGDGAGMRALLYPNARVTIAAPVGPDSTAVRMDTAEQLIGRIGAGGPKMLERMWNPEVRINGPLAMLWTPYDFHRDGKFSHCGVDVFEMVKVRGEWSISAISYTIITPESRCPQSPLGPPR
jgi:hypothetical protein